MNKITKTISICKWFQKNGINDINKPLTPNNILFNFLLDTWGIFALRNWLSKISLYFDILKVRSYPFTIVCTDSYNKRNNKIVSNYQWVFSWWWIKSLCRVFRTNQWGIFKACTFLKSSFESLRRHHWQK